VPEKVVREGVRAAVFLARQCGRLHRRLHHSARKGRWLLAQQGAKAARQESCSSSCCRSLSLQRFAPPSSRAGPIAPPSAATRARHAWIAPTRKIASIKRSLVRAGCVLRRECNLKRLRARRTRLQAASSKCADDDASCVRENIRRLTKVNRRIRKCKKKQQQNVKIVYVVKKVVKKQIPVRKCKGWVHQSMYRNAVTCDSLNKKFNTWLAFARCRRQRNFELSHRCRSSDTGCLRRSFRMIRKVQRQITDAHNEFGTLVERCDRCAGIKIDFRAWLLRQVCI
jgi:hypothetical protein